MDVSLQPAGHREVAIWQPLREAKQGPQTHNLGPASRLLSLALGGAALAFGLRRSRPLGTLITLAGALLVRRGATGHCGVFRMLGASSAGHRSRVSAHESVTIARPREEVERAFVEQRRALLGALDAVVEPHFADAPGNRGTEIALVATRPLLGGGLALIASLVRGQSLAGQLRDALRRFKAHMEAGEAPTLLGQPVPAGRFLA